MANYLVTGVAGFIGSAIARELVQRGEKVRGLDDFSTGKRENLREIGAAVDVREATLLDRSSVAAACKGMDYVIHEAALPSVPKSIAEPELTNAVNIDGTLNLLLAAHDARVQRVVYAASSSAYGDGEVFPSRERCFRVQFRLTRCKSLRESFHMQTFASVYGLETVCLRYFNVFGPRQDANSQSSAVLAKFITQMLQGESPTIFGDGEQSRDFTYVDNVVQANPWPAWPPPVQFRDAYSMSPRGRAIR